MSTRVGKKGGEPTPGNVAIGKLADAAKALEEASSAMTKKESDEARLALEGLQRTLAGIDPIREPRSIFDPSDPRVVGKFVGVALVAQEKVPLAGLPAFYGSGVYALYYNGPNPAYAPLVGRETPIYVGKADPQSASAKTAKAQGPKLHGRLREHLRSITKAMNDPAATLDAKDFLCRFLVVQSGWQTAAENYLINLFKPIWNDELGLCFGIGKHGDSPDTRGNLRSPWDTLHPGREWASRLKKDGTPVPDAKPRERITKEIGAHFAAHPPFGSETDILKQFFADLHQGA